MYRAQGPAVQSVGTGAGLLGARQGWRGGQRRMWVGGSSVVSKADRATRHKKQTIGRAEKMEGWGREQEKHERGQVQSGSCQREGPAAREAGCLPGTVQKCALVSGSGGGANVRRAPSGRLGFVSSRRGRRAPAGVTVQSARNAGWGLVRCSTPACGMGATRPTADRARRCIYRADGW